MSPIGNTSTANARVGERWSAAATTLAPTRYSIRLSQFALIVPPVTSHAVVRFLALIAAQDRRHGPSGASTQTRQCTVTTVASLVTRRVQKQKLPMGYSAGIRARAALRSCCEPGGVRLAERERRAGFVERWERVENRSARGQRLERPAVQRKPRITRPMPAPKPPSSRRHRNPPHRRFRQSRANQGGLRGRAGRY